ncbi:Uncharacterised protein [Vibrio cholerae]|nr:Uncharacterised protein [Vibrio cholerae]
MQLAHIFRFGAITEFNVFRQLLHLSARYRLTKILARDVRQLVRFIENKHFGFRN